jgi:hypothetical protein
MTIDESNDDDYSDDLLLRSHNIFFFIGQLSRLVSKLTMIVSLVFLTQLFHSPNHDLRDQQRKQVKYNIHFNH